MFATWLLVSALLCYVVTAYMWSPSQKKLDKEYEETECSYRRRENVISRIGMLVNR